MGRGQRVHEMRSEIGVCCEEPRLVALERLILAEHPYDTAEFVVLPIQSGSAMYLDWITASATGAG